MATTTNYGWTTPDDTSLVKDGASAIRTLGSAIDTSLNTALGTKKAGLVLLNTTSFSAVSSQSFNNVFSATYTNYTIRSYFTAFSAADEFCQLRFRNAGADNSTANYDLEKLKQESTTVSGARTTGATSLNCFDCASASTTKNQSRIDIIGPFAAAPTVVFTHDVYVSPAPSVKQSVRTGLQTQSTSFDGFTIFPTSGTMTGTISVYGWNV